MEKRLFVQLNGNRKVIGVLRGYDVSRLFRCSKAVLLFSRDWLDIAASIWLMFELLLFYRSS